MFTYTNVYKDWVTVVVDMDGTVTGIAFKPGTKLATTPYVSHYNKHDLALWEAIKVLNQCLREDVDAQEGVYNPPTATLPLETLQRASEMLESLKSIPTRSDATLWEG